MKKEAVMYIRQFDFPGESAEIKYISGFKYTCYDSFYPFWIFPDRGLETIDFEPITIFCGGNGSGKTTALNIIAEKLGLHRDSAFNRTSFFRDFTDMCRCRTFGSVPEHSCIITSDDVFDYMLDIRTLNEGIDIRREELFAEYTDARYSGFKLNSLDDYDQLKKVNNARRLSKSKFARGGVMDNVRGRSNGENAFSYFADRIRENALYLLDEPENSLSAERQLELARFLEDSVRFFGCQFILSTHSPFLLSLRDARIYNFDARPISVCRWTELKNVRTFFDFFMTHREEFG